MGTPLERLREARDLLTDAMYYLDRWVDDVDDAVSHMREALNLVSSVYDILLEVEDELTESPV